MNIHKYLSNKRRKSIYRKLSEKAIEWILPRIIPVLQSSGVIAVMAIMIIATMLVVGTYYGAEVVEIAAEVVR